MSSSTQCEEELLPQSNCSPGTIKGTERLGRHVYDERHWDEASKLLAPAAFSMEDFINAARKGASFTRIDFSDKETVTAQAEAFVARKADRKHRGLGVGRAEKIRAIVHSDGLRVFCVVDDGYIEGEYSDLNHALVRLSEALKQGVLKGFSDKRLKSFLKPYRDQLARVCSPVLPLEKIFS